MTATLFVLSSYSLVWFALKSFSFLYGSVKVNVNVNVDVCQQNYHLHCASLLLLYWGFSVRFVLQDHFFKQQ